MSADNRGLDYAAKTTVTIGGKLSKSELRAVARQARVEVASTLDAIELKLNLPKQMRIRTRRFTHTLHQLGEDKPGALVGIALGAASIVGGIIWLGARAILDKR